MAIGDSYATVSDYLNRYSDTDKGLGDDLLAVSRWLDSKLNQPYGFWKDEAVTSKVYAEGDHIVPIADTAGLVVKRASGAAIDWDAATTLVLDTDYELLPRNPVSGWPYTGITFGNWVSVSVINPTAHGLSGVRYRVTAIHGWPSVPDGIKTATITFTAMLRLTSPWATQTINEMDQAIEASPQARSVLKGLIMQYNPYPVAVA